MRSKDTIANTNMLFLLHTCALSRHNIYFISISLSVMCVIEKIMKEERERGEENSINT